MPSFFGCAGQLRSGSHPPVSLLLFLQSAPPSRTFAAFKDDCMACGMSWHCPAAQQFCVAMFIKNPLVLKYPPRRENVAAFLKQFITQLELLDPAVDSEERGENGIIDPLLMDAYIHCAILRDNAGSKLQDSMMCYKTFYFPSSDVMFLPVRLASGQFKNVGLSLWPAAFVLAQLLLTELCSFSPVILPREGELRFLELGAGAGLTPITLSIYHTYCKCCSVNNCNNGREKRERIWSYVLTDYQQELIDNILFNLRINNIEVMQPGEPVSEGLKRASVNAVEILDWSEHEENEQKLQNWGCNVILAADCIYDVNLINFFVVTLQQALSAVENSVAIVVQTHRQNETMKVFFEGLHTAGMSVCSYCLLPFGERSFSSENCVVLSGNVFQDGCISDFALISHVINRDGSFFATCVEGSRSGWVGSFFIQMEAVVGVHVIRLVVNS